MWNKDVLRFRPCDPAQALPGWCLRCVARCQGLPGQTFDRPRHGYTSIEFIEDGSGILTIRGEEHHLGKGDAFILPEGIDHKIVCDDIHPWRVLFLDCTGDLPRRLAEAYGLGDRCVFPGVSIAQPLRNLLNHVGDDADVQARTGLTIHEIYALIHAAVKRPSGWPDIVVKAKAFIDANLESTFRLSDVAAHVSCSEAHLSRQFRRHVGTPPGDYLLSRRMDLAKALLDATREPIKTIAERLGYRDGFAFSHAFKAATGLSPKAWREQQG